MLRCKTLHDAFGEVYNSLEDMVDSFGENIIMKLEWWMIPNSYTCYEESNIADGEETDRQKMLADLYRDIETIEGIFHEELNNADNDVAEIIWKIRSKLTDLCALLKRELYAIPKDEEE